MRFSPRMYWPCSSRGWLFYLGIGAVWLIGGGAISLLLLPQNAIAGFIAILALLIAVNIIFTMVARRTGMPFGERKRQQTSN